jgi:hypothetical protein
VADYILLMHTDGGPEAGDAWEAYIEKLNALGVFRGGSSIGAGTTLRKQGAPGPLAAHLAGFIRVEAPNLEAARKLVEGNPAYEAGATVEVRELPED